MWAIWPEQPLYRTAPGLTFNPRYAWQLGDVHRDKECLVARQQPSGRQHAGETLFQRGFHRSLRTLRQRAVMISDDQIAASFFGRDGSLGAGPPLCRTLPTTPRRDPTHAEGTAPQSPIDQARGA